MAEFTLRLSAQDSDQHDPAATLYWTTDQHSSFTTGLDPWLRSLGPVPALNVDLARIAVTAFAADRSVVRERGGANWNQRRLSLTVPVSDPDAWAGAADRLSAVMGFLSGDLWQLSFTGEPSPPEARTTAAADTAPERVVLVSGGADSAVGALHSRSLLTSAQRHILVSHFGNTMLSPIQRRVTETAAQLIPGPGQDHVSIHLTRRSLRHDGSSFPTEPSSRSRSLMFLALGLAVASVYSVPLWIPENGFASINPPLGPERLGSLSTRTTHPAFLQNLGATLTAVGAHADIHNPFTWSTKGEMFTRTAVLVGPQEASAFLSATHSCALTGQRAHGISSETHCGVCFGCVLRRTSFAASGVADTTTYIAPTDDPRVASWLDRKTVEPAVRSFTRRGVRTRDLAALTLPSSVPLRQALDLCHRGVAELRSLYP